MRVLIWNLNHRAARRRMPEWIAAATSPWAADVVVLTEYVEGPDHDRFLGELDAQGLQHSAQTESRKGQNQVLIASRAPSRRGYLVAPAFHEFVPPNVLHVVLEESGVNVLGCRVPAFTGAGARQFKRRTWEWLLTAAEELHDGPSIIAGDFNTTPGDGAAKCGDCVERLLEAGWHWARPSEGYSFRSANRGSPRQIDHVFLSPALWFTHAEYAWKFQTLAPDAASGTVGLPDHAMLVADLGSSGLK